MDKDLKDLINSVEVETKTRAQLESLIISLQEEIKRLKSRVKEQHLLIEEQGDQIGFAQSDLPSEITILKDIITSQRKDLTRRDEKIDKLNNKIDELTSQMEKPKDGTFEYQTDELIEAKELILKLSEENEEYRNQIDDLKNQLVRIESETIDLEETNKAQIEENEEMVNIKRLNFQLMEQNGLLRVEIETLKAQIQERVEELVSEELELANKKIDNLTLEIDSLNAQLQERIEKVNSEELELANKKIEALKLEIEDYDAQLKFLQKELENSIEPTTISTEEALEFAKMREQFDNIKSELLKYQKENELLNNKLLELETQAIELNDVEITTNSFSYDFPEQYQIALFKRMYRFMSDNNKNAIINTLIKDLNNKNNEIKRCAIKILSEIKDKKVYDAFLKLIHDDDWLIRYNLIKALSKFDFESEEFKKLLKKLLNDADVDVRELAAKILNEISN